MHLTSKHWKYACFVAIPVGNDGNDKMYRQHSTLPRILLIDIPCNLLNLSLELHTECSELHIWYRTTR